MDLWFAALYGLVQGLTEFLPISSTAHLRIVPAFFGTGLGMSLLMAALATGSIGIVTTLSSMTPIMILPMVWARTGTPPRARSTRPG